MTRLLASSTDHALKAGVSRGCRALAGGGVAQVHQGKPRATASPSLRGRHPEGDRTPGVMVWIFAEEALQLAKRHCHRHLPWGCLWSSAWRTTPGHTAGSGLDTTTWKGFGSRAGWAGALL